METEKAAAVWSTYILSEAILVGSIIYGAKNLRTIWKSSRMRTLQGRFHVMAVLTFLARCGYITAIFLDERYLFDRTESPAYAVTKFCDFCISFTFFLCFFLMALEIIGLYHSTLAPDVTMRIDPDVFAFVRNRIVFYVSLLSVLVFASALTIGGLLGAVAIASAVTALGYFLILALFVGSLLITYKRKVEKSLLGSTGGTGLTSLPQRKEHLRKISRITAIGNVGFTLQMIAVGVYEIFLGSLLLPSDAFGYHVLAYMLFEGLPLLGVLVVLKPTAASTPLPYPGPMQK